jgi:hypothetical protein
MSYRRLAMVFAAGVLTWGINTGAAQAQTALFDFEEVPATWNDPGGGPTTRQGSHFAQAGTFTGNPVVSIKNGVRVTAFRFLTAPFDVVFNANPLQGDKPVSWGNKSLDPFFNITIDNTPPLDPSQPNKIVAGASSYWMFAFSSAVEGQDIQINSVSLDFGDYGSATPGASDSDTGILRLYSSSLADAQGETPIGFGFATNPPSLDDVVTPATVTAIAGSGTVRLATFESITTNGTADNSVFLDNLFLNFTAVTVPEPGTVALLAPALLTGVFAVRRRKR